MARLLTSCHGQAEFHRISRGVGIEFDIFPQVTSLLQSAGFVNIEAHQEPTPIGTWPKDKRLKEIGLYFRTQFIEAAVDGYTLALFTRFGSWTEVEPKVLIAHVRNEITSNKMHLYTHWYVSWQYQHRFFCAPRLA